MVLIIPASEFLLDDRVFAPLGILRVAASLEKAGVAVSVVDMSGGVRVEIPEADCYGITATSAQYPNALKIRNLIRSRSDAKIILGGPHVTMANAGTKKGSARSKKILDELVSLFDVLVCGDGERAVFKALEADAPKIIDADDPQSEFYIETQDEAPLPARHLIDLKSYMRKVDGVPVTSIVSQLGCPFGCGFCGGRLSSFYRRVRLRSVENIMREVAELHQRYGYRGFMFQDDELNVSKTMPEFMKALIDYQREHGVSFSMRGFIKSQLFTDEQARLMREAGFREILVGFESAHDRILKNINKGATLAENNRCVAICKRNDLGVKALMSLGHPGESRETAEAVMNWLLEICPADFDVTVITPYPGTPYFDQAVKTDKGWTYTAKSGDRLHMDEVDYNSTADYYKGMRGEYKSHVFTDYLTAQEIVELRDGIEEAVRDRLGIAYPVAQHEHSMGQV